MPSGVWRALRGFKTVFGWCLGDRAARACLSPPGGAGAVQLALGATGKMTDSAVMRLGWKVLGAAMVLDESDGNSDG